MVAPAVEDAIAAGIKVAAVYTPIGPDINSFEQQVEGVLCTVGNPIPLNGQRLGEMTVKAAKTLDKDKIRVAYISGGFQLPFENSKQREFEKAIKADPRIELVAVAEAGFMRNKALAASQDFLQAHPDLDIVTTSGDNMTIGVEEAVIDAGLQDKVILVGNGCAKIAVEAIREGRWYASYPYLPYTESAEATKILINALRGKEQPYQGINIEQISPLKPDLWLDIENIDKHKDFKPEWRG
jgi:ribose transport system substrate-binding protein